MSEIVVIRCDRCRQEIAPGAKRFGAEATIRVLNGEETLASLAPGQDYCSPACTQAALSDLVQQAMTPTPASAVAG